MLVQTLISVVVFAATANAWGDTLAHPVTGTLAQKYLSANGLKLVQSLLDPSFSGSLGGQTANWADVWRSTHSATAPWHFVDMMKAPPQSCGYVSTDCVGRNCIVAAITDQTNVLLQANCAPSTAATQAVQFLAHFLGDISQPLHNCNRDVGGNSDAVTYTGCSSPNFHSIHDTCIPASFAVAHGKTATDYAGVATVLDGLYSKNIASYTTSTYIDLTSVDSNNILLAAIAMANDANALDCSKSAFWTLYDANTSQDFSGAYYTATAPLLMEQVAKAGYRMAAWLNAIGDQCYGSAQTTTTTKTTTTAATTKTTSTKTTTTTTAKTSTTTSSTITTGASTGTCAHSACAAGLDLGPLVKGCSPCVTAVCAQYSYCCTTQWTPKCVTLATANTLCGC